MTYRVAPCEQQGATKNTVGFVNVSTSDQQENKAESWENREVTAEEHVAAIKIQKVWRGYYVRRVKRARTPGEPKFQVKLCFRVCVCACVRLALVRICNDSLKPAV